MYQLKEFEIKLYQHCSCRRSGEFFNDALSCGFGTSTMISESYSINCDGSCGMYVNKEIALKKRRDFETKIIQQFKLYPNPSTGEVIFEGVPSEKTINLLSLEGKLIQSIRLNKSNINYLNFSELPIGIYFIKYQDFDQIHTERLIIQK